MTDTTTSTPVAPATPARPRIRFNAIIWGIILGAIATTGLYVMSSSGRRAEFLSWLESLDGGTFALLAVLACGAILVVSGLLAAIRRIQRGPEHPPIG